MNTLKPSMCKSDGLISLCDCVKKNIKEEQRKCLGYKKGINGYCDYYRLSIGSCSNYDGYFSIDKVR